MLNLNITVTRNPNELTLEVYEFTLIDDRGLYLREYRLVERPTTRHKFKAEVKHATRRFGTGNRRENTMTAAEVVVPDDVKTEAKAKFLELMAQIPVKVELN